ncbi:hypothetical protein JL722_9308 [Aureococcus anophagefferens]|nr:hypothetical protein JL722_9308 [Aureococcus anophagefferens]
MAADKPAADADKPDATKKADALAAAVAKEVRANAPAIEDCFRAELARTRGNASFGEGDLAGALRDWTEAVRLSGDLPGAAAESKARALGNLSMLKLSYFADVRGAVDDAAARGGGPDALALADCSAVDDELLDVADVAADLPLALADLSLHRTSCTRAGVDALRDALAKDEHNTALRIDFDGPPADDAPPPVESPLT